MGSTGETCQQSGIYQATCRDGTQIALSKGERFPPCGRCGAAVAWRLIRPTY